MKYNYDKIKENDICGPCAMQGEIKNAYRMFGFDA
jgi:hypothetical protein